MQMAIKNAKRMIKLTNTFGPLLSKLVSLRAPPASQEMDRRAGTAGSEARLPKAPTIGGQAIFLSTEKIASSLLSVAPPRPAALAAKRRGGRNDTRFHVSNGLYHRRMLCNLNRHAFGQSLVEYVTIVGIITMVFVTLTPNIKRSIQALVKMTADQIGEQKNADFVYDLKKRGYVIEAGTTISAKSNREVQEFIGATSYLPDESTTMKTNSITDLGFREDRK